MQKKSVSLTNLFKQNIKKQPKFEYFKTNFRSFSVKDLQIIDN